MNDPVVELNETLAGRYTVEKEIGAGGMATVYLARDVRHERKVAIKVLRPELAAVIGAERFVREIQTIATLQHPHILGLIDSGEARGTAYYVMPFVEGESLRDWLARDRQLPVEDAVRIASEVASALDYAHRHGIIHRDIKPENILLNDGSAMVADFGIALAVSSAGTRMTETGMSLGTPHYMSPEQAMGERELGARSDIYALGCVTYEMLLGEPPFTGPTAQSIIARVITDTPRSITAQRRSIPRHVEAATLKALEKLPADRFGTAREFSDAVNGRTLLATPAAAATAPQSAARGSWRIGAAAVAGLVVGAALFAFASGSTRRSTGSAQWTGELLGGPAVAAGARVSPDGQTIAFEAMVNGQTQVGVLKPASGDWAVLTRDSTRGIAQELAWSRDGARIFYTRFFAVPRGIYSISPLGGDERLVLEDAGNPDPLPDGSLLLSRLNAANRLQLLRYTPQTSRLDTLDATADFAWAGARFRAFPDGKHVVFWGRTSRDTVVGVRILDLASGTSRKLPVAIQPTDFHGFAFSPDGRWVVLGRAAGDLVEYFAVPADGSAKERQLYTASAATQWGPDVAPDGSLHFDDVVRITEVHRSPSGSAGRRLVAGLSGYQIVPLSDGRLLAMVSSGGRPRIVAVTGGREPVPFVMTNEPTREPLAMLGSDNVLVHIVASDGTASIASVAVKTGRIVKRFPMITAEAIAGSPDGKTIFYSTNSEIWRQAVDGSKPVRLTTGVQMAVDPGNRYLVVNRIADSGVQLVRVPLDGGKEQLIEVRGNLRPAPGGLMPDAIAADGRIALQVVTPQSWFWPVATLDPSTGKTALTASGIAYDMYGGWAPDGSLVISASPMESRMWRLKPKGAVKWWE